MKTNQENRLVSEKVTQLLTISKQLISRQKNVMNSTDFALDSLTMERHLTPYNIKQYLKHWDQ